MVYFSKKFTDFSVHQWKIDNNLQNKMGLMSKNETLKKTPLINSFIHQTFHRSSSITKYTSKAFIAFVVISAACSFIYLGFTAQVLKVRRTPGPTAY